MSLGIWYEAIMRWLGVATSLQAQGQVARPMLVRDGGTYVTRIFDQMDVIGQMACGAALQMHLSTVTGPPERHLTLRGTQGAIRYDGEALMVCAAGEDDFAPVEIPDNERGGWRVEEEFIGAIRGEEEIRLTRFEDGLRYMQFVEASVRAAQSGEAVELPILS
jgi:predicted dehydrogenase